MLSQRLKTSRPGFNLGILLQALLFLLTFAHQAHAYETPDFKISLPAAWKLEKEDSFQGYFNRTSKKKQTITFEKIEMGPEQTGFDFLASKRIKIERERARLFSAFGLENYTIVNVEEHTAKNGHKFQVIQSRYLGPLGQEVQMYERQYPFGTTLFRVTYTEETPALNELDQVNRALDNVQPIVPKGWREPASASETGRGLFSENPRGFTDYAAEKLNPATRNPQYCSDVPEADRYTADENRSFIGKMWQATGGVGYCVIDQIKALLYDLPKMLLDLGFDDETQKQVGAAASTLWSEFKKDMTGFVPKVLTAFSDSVGKSIPQFWCYKIAKQVEFMCNTGITVAMFYKLLLNLPLAAEAQAKLLAGWERVSHLGKNAGKAVVDTGKAVVDKTAATGKIVVDKTGEAIQGARQATGKAVVRAGEKIGGVKASIEEMPKNVIAHGDATSTAVPPKIVNTRTAEITKGLEAYSRPRGKAGISAEKLSTFIGEADAPSRATLLRNMEEILRRNDPKELERMYKAIADMKFAADGKTLANADFAAASKEIDNIAHGFGGRIANKGNVEESAVPAVASAPPPASTNDGMAVLNKRPVEAGGAPAPVDPAEIKGLLKDDSQALGKFEQLMRNSTPEEQASISAELKAALSTGNKDKALAELTNYNSMTPKASGKMAENLRKINVAESPTSATAATRAAESGSHDFSALNRSTETRDQIRRSLTNANQAKFDELVNRAGDRSSKILEEMSAARQAGKAADVEKILIDYKPGGFRSITKVEKALAKLNREPGLGTRIGRNTIGRVLGRDPQTGLPRSSLAAGDVQFGNGGALTAKDIDNALVEITSKPGMDPEAAAKLRTTWNNLPDNAKSYGVSLAEKNPDKFLQVLDGYAKSGANEPGGAGFISGVKTAQKSLDLPPSKSGFGMAKDGMGKAFNTAVDPFGNNVVQGARAAAVPAAIHERNQNLEQQQHVNGIYAPDDDSPAAQNARMTRDPSTGLIVSPEKAVDLKEGSIISSASSTVHSPSDLEGKIKELSEVKDGKYKNLLDQYHRLLKKHRKDYPDELVKRVEEGDFRQVIKEIQKQGKAPQANKAHRPTASKHQPAHHHHHQQQRQQAHNPDKDQQPAKPKKKPHHKKNQDEPGGDSTHPTDSPDPSGQPAAEDTGWSF